MSQQEPELVAALRPVVTAFEALGLQYCVPLEVFLASPEDTILAKLDWYRKGGGTSDRQWRDVLGVLKVTRPRLPARVGRAPECAGPAPPRPG